MTLRIQRRKAHFTSRWAEATFTAVMAFASEQVALQLMHGATRHSHALLYHKVAGVTT